MILGLQISAILFALVMIYFAVLHYKRGEINGVEIFFWLLIWSATIFIILIPDILRIFAQTYLSTRLFDLMVVAGFVVVISMAVKAYITTKKLEKKLEKLIRENVLSQMVKQEGVAKPPKKRKR